MAKKTTTKKATKKVAEEKDVENISAVAPSVNDLPKKDEKHQPTVEEKAYLLSLESRSVDEWNWKLAEVRLAAQKVKNVTDDLIRQKAAEIATENLSLDKIHWEIAEKST